jgi:hypothetical protein
MWSVTSRSAGSVAFRQAGHASAQPGVRSTASVLDARLRNHAYGSMYQQGGGASGS